MSNREIPSFTQVLSQIRKGRLNDEITEQLAAAVLSARATGKKASVTLKLEIVPKGEENEFIHVKDDVKTVLPRLDYGTAMFFATNDGGLVRDERVQGPLFNAKGEETPGANVGTESSGGAGRPADPLPPRGESLQ